MKVNVELADQVNKTSTKTNLFLLLERLSTILLVVRNFLTLQKTRIRLPSKDSYHKNTSIHKLNMGHKIIQIFLSTFLCLFLASRLYQSSKHLEKTWEPSKISKLGKVFCINSDFETKFLQRVRFWIRKLTMCHGLNQIICIGNQVLKQEICIGRKAFSVFLPRKNIFCNLSYWNVGFWRRLFVGKHQTLKGAFYNVSEIESKFLPGVGFWIKFVSDFDMKIISFWYNNWNQIHHKEIWQSFLCYREQLEPKKSSYNRL